MSSLWGHQHIWTQLNRHDATVGIEEGQQLFHLTELQCQDKFTFKVGFFSSPETHFDQSVVDVSQVDILVNHVPVCFLYSLVPAGPQTAQVFPWSLHFSLLPFDSLFSPFISLRTGYLQWRWKWSVNLSSHQSHGAQKCLSLKMMTGTFTCLEK